MPHELTIPPIAAAPPAPAAPNGPTRPPAAAPAATQTPFPNPTLQLDPALGIVVIEFRDRAGKVDSSIPTQRQLDAYRTAADRSGLPDQGRPGQGAPTLPKG